MEGDRVFEAFLGLQRPDRVAVCASLDEHISAHLLATRDFLRRLGVRIGDIVAVLLPRNSMLVTAYLSLQQLGAVYVPLDAANPPQRILDIVHDCIPRLIISESSLRSRFVTSLADVPVLLLDTHWQMIDNAPAYADNIELNLTPSCPSYVIYTSGSTGAPKGVVITHKGVMNYFLPIQFDASLSEINVALTSGAALCFFDEQTQLNVSSAPGRALLEELERFHITAACLPPVFLSHLPFEEMGLISSSKIETVIIGGEVCSHAQIERCRRLVSYSATASTIDAHHTDIGEPINNTTLYCLDGNMDHASEGELYLESPGLASGYSKRPALTASKFVPNPFSITNDRLYASGDLVRTRVVNGSTRIELGEVEGTIIHHHPLVKQAVALILDRAPNDQALVVFIVPDESNTKSITLSDVRSLCSKHLPRYMIPSDILLVDRLPRSLNEKIDTRQLIELYTHRSPPEGACDASLAPIWNVLSSELQISVANPGGFNATLMDDLGISSIQIVKLLERLRVALRVQVTPAEFLSCVTLEDLGRLLSRKCGPDAKTAIVEDSYDRFEYPMRGLMMDPSFQAIEALTFPIRDTVDSQPHVIFMTGATGYLGKYLLKRLLLKTSAVVVCLVRNRAWKSATLLGAANLEEVQHFLPRVQIVYGDLQLDRFGLNIEEWALLRDTADTVVHCGSVVNVVLPYEEMRRTNVQGMQTILSLCAEGCPKLLHLVSTLSVITSGPIEAGKVIESPLSTLSFDRNGVFHGGYAASKFVAETLVDRCIQRGLNASVYRPGLLWCDSETHKSAPDWLSAMLIAIRHLGQYPQEIFQQGAFETDLTPVDYAADIISDSISSNKRHPSAVHIAQPYHTSMEIILGELSHNMSTSLSPVPLSKWISNLDAASSGPAFGLPHPIQLFGLLYDGANTLRRMEELLFPAKKYQFELSDAVKSVMTKGGKPEAHIGPYIDHIMATLN